MHEDPYPVYARLREEAPLYRNEELDFWALSRHDDVGSAFRNGRTYSNGYGVSLEPTAWGPKAYRTMSFLAMDPPRHTRMRALVSRGFTPRRVAALEPRIREITRLHLEPALEGGEFDWITAVAGRVPMDVISELMGVPEADRQEVRRLADVLMHRDDGLQDIPPEGMAASLELIGYYADMLALRRARRTGDLTSALLDAEVDGDRMSDEEIIAFLFLMVVAGNETTTKLLGNALYWAFLNPAEGAKALGGAVGPWVEETLRYDTSSQMLARRVAEEVEVHGTRLPAGARVLLLVGSANRDERVFPDPDRYDLDRDTGEMISFGRGGHFCLGASLARMEGRVVLGELIRRITGYEIDPAGAERMHAANVRGFAHLPMSVTRR
ncbi:cytochrome P450 [Streptosporangium sp. DT93]|uniref:cytochrome P450 n=1 Tax=Streptosporangium sp. DT93 TaxID=3393428 RepID=UPI003CF0D514